ncbi:tripartite-type tricarboxylate transporter receptor subunit TctC [Bradyrhizobium algeriense]|uniref:Tripartite-type tricarboxylate transporter receptor subunit TctC n=1 Tax=Bradyrhizobium algeriense TaxID=634784 RepID=A0ABU8B5K1_9BRAD
MITRRTFGAGVAASVLAPAASWGETFPSRPIKFLVPFAAGSATDAVARLVGDYVASKLKQAVVVENKAGASGILAAQNVALSAPDGYTILITTNTTHGANQSLLKQVPYDALNDFTPVTRIGISPLILLVNPSLPVKSVAELVAYGKANPGKLTFGAGSSSSRICGELLKMRMGFEATHVPYRSIPQAVTDLMGGQIAFTFSDPLGAVPQIEAGKVRGLAVSGTSRIKLAPDLPTMVEAGVPDYNIIAYFAAFAPAKMPAPIANALAKALSGAVRDKAIIEKFDAVGIEPSPSTPEELHAQVAAEIIKWAAIVKSAGIEPQ